MTATDALTDPELAALARDGGTEGREAVGILIKRHKRLVHRLVNKANAAPCIDREDLIQVGMIAIIRAAKKWEPTRSIKFVTVPVHSLRSVASVDIVFGL